VELREVVGMSAARVDESPVSGAKRSPEVGDRTIRTLEFQLAKPVSVPHRNTARLTR